MKSIRLKDRVQSSMTNDEMFWLNRILSWSFDHPDWVLVVVWGLYTLLDLITMLVMGWEIDLGFALRNLVFGFGLSVMMYYWILPKILISKEWKSGILMGIVLVILLSTVKFYLRFPGELFWNLSFEEIWMEWLRIIQFQGLTFSIWITLAHILLSKDFKKKSEQFEELHFQYQALQVEPHFVLNMLSEISFSAKKFSNELSEEIQQFSRVLKYGYKDHRNQNSLLDEITAIEAYTFCQRRRFGDSSPTFFTILLTSTASFSGIRVN